MNIPTLNASQHMALTFSILTPDNSGMPDGLELVTIRVASQICCVSLTTVRQWIATGLWPVPCAACRNRFFFKESDVECWVATGVWPGDCHFLRQAEGTKDRAGMIAKSG
ncbi:MAG: hypothetical protein P4L84_13265 [Isosphaeraceae bacterium]|nr:hypothetical protein [Isosphaeraceae bacterium]